MNLDGKVIIVTGGAGLLGRQHAGAIRDAGGIPVVFDITPPVGVTDSLYIVDVGESIPVDATQSYDPEGGSIVDYRWTLDRAGGDVIVYGSSTTLPSVSSLGDYPLLLQVTDASGNSANFSSIVRVTPTGNDPPSIEILDSESIDLMERQSRYFWMFYSSGTGTPGCLPSPSCLSGLVPEFRCLR